MDADSSNGDDAVQGELARASERTADLLRSAGETAAGIRADAEEFAQATRGAAYSFAQQHRAEAKADADKTKAEARAEADRILTEAGKQRADLEATNAHLTERRDHLLAELERVADSAWGLAGAHREQPTAEESPPEESPAEDLGDASADPLQQLGSDIVAEEGAPVPSPFEAAEPNGDIPVEAGADGPDELDPAPEEAPKPRRFSAWLPPRRRDFEQDRARPS